MNDKMPTPGVNRTERISSDGLDRLEKQLASGINIGDAVLAQWIKRYGDKARQVIRKYNRYRARFDRL